MLEKIHGVSLLAGIAVGAGMMFLGGAAVAPQSAPPSQPVSGRFQLVTMHTNDQMGAYVIDTQTGQSVQLNNGGSPSSIMDPWKDHP